MKFSAMTRSQMAALYHVCLRTLNKWLKEKEIQIRRGLITPKDQELIFSKLGYPPGYEKWNKKGADW